MDENTNNVNQNQGQQVQTEQTAQVPVQNAQPVPNQVAVTPASVEQKEGLLQKAKKHWKGIAATVAAIGTATAASIFAYRKGNQAGMQMGMQMPGTDDGAVSPLDPNYN